MARKKRRSPCEARIFSCEARIFSCARLSVASLVCASAHERFEEKIQMENASYLHERFEEKIQTENASYLQPAPSRRTSKSQPHARTCRPD